jgi:hypothetical protein
LAHAKRVLFWGTLLLSLALSTGASATPAEQLATLGQLRLDLKNPNDSRLGFDVDKADGKVQSISVLITIVNRNGDKEQQIFEIRAQDAGYPIGEKTRPWWNKRIGAAVQRVVANPDHVDRVEMSYIVREATADGKQVEARHSQHRYTLATGEQLRNAKNQRVAVESSVAKVKKVKLDKPERELGRIKYKEVQAAFDRLAKNPPNIEYRALPGEYWTKMPDGQTKVHPLHNEHKLVREINRLAAAKRAHPERDYFFRFVLYIHNSEPVTQALIAAHRAGVKIDGIVDWTKARPGQIGHEQVRKLVKAGVSMQTMVRDENLKSQIYAHAKFFIGGYRDASGRIVKGTTMDAEHNTTFSSWPGNQESMLVYQKNPDVATVYNYYFESMKGNAPQPITIDPLESKFSVTHPLYPLRVRGKAAKKMTFFGPQQGKQLLVSRAKNTLQTLSFMLANDEVNRDYAKAVRRGVDVEATVNGWRFENKGGKRALAKLAGAGMALFGNFFNDNGKPATYSPIHHKQDQADLLWFRHSSWNEVDVSNLSDETFVMGMVPKIAAEISARANVLHHDRRYKVVAYGDRKKPAERRTREVQIEFVLPERVQHTAVEKVTFHAGNDPELDGKTVELKYSHDTKTGKAVYTAKKRLSEGFAPRGRAHIKFKNQKGWWSPRGDSFFRVKPLVKGQNRVQRIRLRF